MIKGPIKIIRYSDRGDRQGLQFFFEGKRGLRVFLEEKKGKETSLKENRGKDFFGKKGGGGK